jgi:hypothetical protein
MKSRLVIILFVLVCSYILVNTFEKWHKNVFKWDQSGYQLHLPAVLIYHDIEKLGFYSYIDSVYQPSGEYKNYCIYTLDNGNRINRYSVGPAIHQLPFFLIAHFINTHWLSYPADGYSLPYEWAAILSNVFWVLLGLLAIRKLLLQYFTDDITAITLLTIAFGTNIYCYTAFSAGGAHGYSFFHCALIILLTGKLYSTNKKYYLFYLAIVAGLISITRPVNLLMLLIPLLWGVHNRTALMLRVQFFMQNLKNIGIATLVFIITIMPQLGLWKYVTGQWYYDGYPNEGFIWTEPRIWKGLFSFQKGWLIYTPVCLFALLGIYSMRRQLKQYAPAIIIFIALFIYVTYSWWNWWYGGSYSSRPMADILAVLSLPLAAFITSINNKSFLKKIIYSIMGLLVALNMFQSYQFHKSIIHPERMTAKHYWRHFFSTATPTEEAEQYLLPSKEYYSEMNERYNKVNGK